MIDKTYADIKSILLNQGLLLNLFDILRIVDAKEGTIVELVDGELFTTKVSCNDVFGTRERCKNCSSIRAHYSNETVVKFEYVNDSVLLIFSVPIFIQNRHLVVEIVKNTRFQVQSATPSPWVLASSKKTS